MLMPVKIFFCYAHEDELLLNKLKSQLTPLQRQGLIDVWYDRDISAGTNWEQQIKGHLDASQIILLLVSPDFMSSDYCYSIEMKRALERDERGEARVIPIILRYVYWQGVLGKLQALPTDARPIKSWSDLDEALYNVTEGIRKVIEEITPKSPPPSPVLSTQSVLHAPPPTDLPNKVQNTKEQWLEEGNTLYGLKRNEEALAAYEQALRLDPNYAVAYSNKGLALNQLKRYEEALAACEQTLRLDPNYAGTYNNKGWALNGLKRNEEALAAYEQAIRLDPNYAAAYNNKGNAYYGLKRYEEALVAYEQALRLDPNYAVAYNNKGEALNGFKRYEEALVACEQAIRLDPNLAEAYNNKGEALNGLNRKEEAQQAYEKARQLGYSE
jgi:tetratricopeptide (TPR) repeat protein